MTGVLPEPRVAIGPGNVAGQAREWARALRESGVDAFSFAGNLGRARRLLGKTDRQIPHHKLLPSSVRARAIGSMLSDRTHIIAESMSAILGRPSTQMIDEEADRWASRGVELAAVFHGSDVRDPIMHMERIPSSYFLECPPDWVEATRCAATDRRSRFRAMGIAGFVSTPDLLLDLPEARWCPVVVETAVWDAPEIQSDHPLRVLHVPSRRVPPIKGTRVVEPVLTRLHEMGVIEYVSPEFVPHRDMPALLAGVDVVVDQLMSGFYGVAAVEAMAAGRLVIGNVAPEVRDLLPMQVPILDVSPSELESALRRLADDRDGVKRLAAAGPEYARTVHDGRASATAIASWLDQAG